MVDIVPEPVKQASSAEPMSHVDALPPGTRLAEFEIQALLGVGGFGLVYRAYDTSLHRPVAIKEYMPAALAGRKDGVSVSVRSSGDQSTYQSGLQSFVAEARLLAQFDHPSLVKVYRIWEAHNTAYMVMPLYSGMTLGEARAQMHRPPPEAWLRTVLWSILQALHVLHRHDTLHRDISPDNIFLQDVGPPVLLDLGAARRAISDRSHKLTAVLKVNYAPIEQYAESDELKQGPWTDLYALAAVIYGCLRNSPPQPATARVVRDSMPPVRDVVQTVKKHFGNDYSQQFVRAIAHALEVAPEKRPQSLSAFVTEMKLKAPPRLNKFDWRAELGEPIVSEHDENPSRQFWSTQPHALAQEAQASGFRGRWARWRARRPGWRSTVAWVGLALVVMAVLAGAALNWLHADEPLVATPAPAVTPVVTQVPPPEPAASAPAAAVAAPAVPESETSSRSRAVDVQTESAPASSAVTAKPKRPVKPAPEAEQAAESAMPARKPVAQRKVVETPPPPVRQAGVEAPLCADAGFFAKPMCMYNECQKPENAKRQVCIEELKRYQGRNASPP